MISFLVLPLSHYDIILGMKWLKQFNPKIEWKSGNCYAVSAANLDQKKNERKEKQNSNLNAIQGNIDPSFSTGSNSNHSISALALTGNDNMFHREKNTSVLSLLSGKQYRRAIRDGGKAGMIMVRGRNRPLMKVEEDEKGEEDKLAQIFNINNSYAKSCAELINIMKEYADVFPNELPKGYSFAAGHISSDLPSS